MSNSALEKNIALVRAHGGMVDEAWLETGAAGGFAESVQTRSGLANIKCSLPGGRSIHLHSQFDPVAESDKQAVRCGPWEGRHAFTVGIACGHHVASIARAVGASGAVSAVECNPDVAHAALSDPQFERIAALEHVRMFFAPARDSVRAAMKSAHEFERGVPGVATREYLHAPSMQLLTGHDRAVKAALNMLRARTSFCGDDPRIGFAFDTVHKMKLSGLPLDENATGILFVEAACTEERFYFFESDYEPAELPHNPRTLLFISLSALGDVVMASPALPALRERYPDSRIIFLTEEPCPSLFQRSTLVDRVIGYPRGAFTRRYLEKPVIESLEPAVEMFKELRGDLESEGIDAVVNLHASARSAILAGSLGLPPENIYGYCVGNDGWPVVRGNLWSLSRLLDKMPTGLPHEENNLQVLGLEPSEKRLHIALPAPHELESRIGFPANAAQRSKRLVGINPFASAANRSWPVERFTVLAHSLMETMHCGIMIFAGPGDAEMRGAETMRGALGGDVLVSAGDPPEIAAAAAARCDLFITSDTGPMHFAAAAGARCLVIAGPTLTLPYSRAGHVCIIADLPCSGCGPFPTCENPKCFTLIEIPHAAAVAAVMLSLSPDATELFLRGNVFNTYPHRLLSGGTFQPATPAYYIRLRDSNPPEVCMAAELSRIAVLNAMRLLDDGTRRRLAESRPHTDPQSRPMIHPDTALREVLRRYGFHDPDVALLTAAIETAAGSSAHIPSVSTEAVDLLRLPTKALCSFLDSAGMQDSIEPSKRYCEEFLRATASIIST